MRNNYCKNYKVELYSNPDTFSYRTGKYPVCNTKLMKKKLITF